MLTQAKLTGGSLRTGTYDSVGRAKFRDHAEIIGLLPYIRKYNQSKNRGKVFVKVDTEKEGVLNKNENQVSWWAAGTETN